VQVPWHIVPGAGHEHAPAVHAPPGQATPQQPQFSRSDWASVQVVAPHWIWFVGHVHVPPLHQPPGFASFQMLSSFDPAK